MEKQEVKKEHKVLKNILKYGLVIFFIGFGTLVYFMYNPPAFLIELIRKQAEVQTLKATDLYTKVDKISSLRLGLFHQTAVAEGITVLKNNTTTAPKFIDSNKLEIRFNLLSFFLYGPEKSTLELKIIKPVVNINRNKKGEFDIDSPLFQPREKKEEPKSQIPRILFNLEEGQFNYTDDTFVNKLIVGAKIPMFKAEVQNSEYVKYQTEIYNDKDFAAINGTLNTTTGQAKVDSRLKIENVSKWVNVFYNVSQGKLILKNGAVDLSLNASWDNFKLANLKFNSKGNAKDLIAKVPYYKDVINLSNLSFNLNENKVDINDLILKTQGSTLKLNADSIYNGDNTYIKSNIKGTDLNLNRIINSLDPSLVTGTIKDLKLSGIGDIDLNLDGYYPKLNKKLAFFSYPEKFQPRKIYGKINIDNGSIYGTNIEKVNTRIIVDKNDLKLRNLYIKAFDGKVTGDLNINKLFKGEIGKVDVKQAYFQGDLKADKLDVGKVLTDFDDPVPLEYKPYGIVNANVKVNGKLNDPSVKIKAYSPQLRFNSKYSEFNNINNMYADISYTKNFIDVQTRLNSYDFGNAVIDFKMRNQDRITTKVVTDSLKLKTLNQFIPDNINISSGILSGDVFADFSLKDLRRYKKITPEQLTRIVTAKGNLNLSGVNLLYKTVKSPFTLTNLSGNVFLNSGNGNIASRINLNSNETGIVTANLTLNGLNMIDAKVSTVRFPLKKIEPFVPNLYVKSGLVTINSTIRTSLNALRTKGLTTDQMISYINTDSKIKIDSANLLYKTNNKPITLTNGFADIYVNSNGNDLKSNILLTSSEYGKSNADIFVNDLNMVNARININNMPTATISNFVPKLKSNKGSVTIAANVDTSLNQIRFSKLPVISLINTKAKVSLDNTNLLYSLSDNRFINSTNTNADMYLSLRNGNIATEINYVSDQFGQGDIVSSIKNFDNTYARINIDNMPSKTLETFVPSLKVKSGNGDIRLTLNTSLNALSMEPTLDQLTYLVNAKADINFKNTDMTYGNGKSKVDINNGLANIRFDMNRGIVKSTYLLATDQFGRFTGFLDVDRNRNVVGALSNNSLDLRNVSQFIPNGKIERGIGQFNLAVAGNLKKFSQDPGAIAVRGAINVNNLIASYNSKGKKYPIELSTLRNTFSYTGGVFKTDLSAVSKDLGNLTAYANLESDGRLNGKIYSRNINLPNIDRLFVNNPKFEINRGNMAVTVAFNGLFADIMENPLYFNADGDISVDRFNMIYKDLNKVEKITMADGSVVEQNKQINQPIDKIAMDFNWKKGILNFDSINLREKTSSITGKGKLNINRFLNGDTSQEEGRLILTTNNFNFQDFPISQLANIRDGKINNLELTTNLPRSTKDLKLTLNTNVVNLNFNDQAKIDNILAQLIVDKNIVNLKNVSLFEGENFLRAKGTVNIANMENPSFDLNMNSRKFPIKSIFALIPESVLNRNTSKGSKTDTKNIKLTYKLPINNNYVIKDKKVNVNDLLAYWEQWSLEPLTEQDAKNTSKLAPYWESIDGELSVNADVKGDLLEPVANLDVMISNGNIYNRKINEIFLKADYKDGTINVPNLHFIEEEGGYLIASGSMLQSGKVTLEADGKLNLNWYKSFTKDKAVDVEGDTFLTLDVRGTSTNPDVSISVDADRGGVFNNVYFDDLVLLGNYKNKIAYLNDARLISGGKEAKASGVIPIDESLGSMNVSLGLSGDSLGLVNLFTREIEWLKGSGDVFINAQGSLSDPLLNGKLNIQNAEVYVASLGKPLEKINVDIDLSNHFVKINRAETFLNEGKVSLLGQLDLIGFKPGFVKLKLFADDFRWEQDNMNLGGKLSLNINNTVSEPLIGGKVELTKGEMTFALGRSSSSKSGASAVPKKKSKASIDARFNNLKIDIPKETDFWVRSPFFDLRPYGDLNLKSGSIYSPEVLGYAGIDRGSLYLINNEFRISEASATFGGKDFDKDLFPVNPKLNIVADTKLINPRTRQNVDVEAKITGELEDIPDNKMRIDWTKTGGMSEAEIWSQVVGLDAAQAILSDTGSGQANTIAQFATPYFNRALFNPLTSKVADFLSLDEFSLGIASDAISNPGVALNISKPIIGGLSIGYQGTIRTSNIAQYNFFTRYRFDNGLSLRAAIDERNASSLQGEYGFSF